MLQIPTQPDSFITLQEQLMEFLRQELRTGKFAPGDRIYSEAELRRMTGLSQVTIKRALAALVREGLLLRRQGKGTFVSEPSIVIRQSVHQFYSFVKDYSALGYSATIALVSFSLLPAEKEDVAAELLLAPQDLCYKLVRVLSLDGTPVGYEHNYIPENLFPGITSHEVESVPLYDILCGRFGQAIAHAKGTITPVNLTAPQAERLHSTRGKAALLYCRTSYNQQDQPIEYTKAINRGDCFQYTYEIYR